MIDFSRFGSLTNEIQTTIKQNLTIYLGLKELSLKDFQNNKDMEFHSKRANNTTSIYGKGKICKYLQNQISVSSNRFAYIENPLFNSTELVRLIKEQE